MKVWNKPELNELSVDETLVGDINEFPESEPTTFTGPGATNLLGNS